MLVEILIWFLAWRQLSRIFEENLFWMINKKAVSLLIFLTQILHKDYISYLGNIWLLKLLNLNLYIYLSILSLSAKAKFVPFLACLPRIFLLLCRTSSQLVFVSKFLVGRIWEKIRDNTFSKEFFQSSFLCLLTLTPQPPPHLQV